MVTTRVSPAPPTRRIAWGVGLPNAILRVWGPVPLLAALCLGLAGCGDHIRAPSPEELARFRAADKAGPAVDMNRVLQAKIVPGPYRVAPGDVLRVEMPRFPDQQPAETAGVDVHQVYNCRVGDRGTIVLPMIGTLAVRGKSLAEVEAAIDAQYYPRYVASLLPVYVSVQEYQTQRVSVVGAVTQPGIHALRHDQMTLVALLQQAGGITIQGAAVIRINRAETPGTGPRPEPVRDRPVDLRRRERDTIPAPAAGDAGVSLGVGPQTRNSALGSPTPRVRGSDWSYPPEGGPGIPNVKERVWGGVPNAEFRVGGPQPTPNGRPILQAVFEQEGPLRTTGWLRVEQANGEASVRKWLDISNGPQRREFLGALAAQSRWPGIEDLDVNLARLGAYLEGQPADRGPKTADRGRNTGLIRPAELAAGWRIVGDHCFAIAFYDAGGGPPLPSRTVAVKAPMEVAGAVGSARGDAPRPPAWNPGPPSRSLAMGKQSETPAEPLPGADSGIRGWPPKADASALQPERDPQRDTSRLGTQPSSSAKRRDWEGLPDADLRARDPEPRDDPLSGGTPTQTLVLPVRGLNIPFTDVTLEEGDTVVVEPPREQLVSVVGLVTHPGNMPYPPNGRYTLIQAIAFAGGLDLIADPRYITVYRLTSEGEIVSVTFRLVKPRHQPQLTDALALPLKPGDVVSVEHTLRTRINVFFDRVFRISLGVYVDPTHGGY